MPLTGTFVKQVKPKNKDASAGEKHADSGGMYLLVKPTGKYWRMDYRFAGQRKTLALGVYPEVSLAKARKRREEAKERLADGVDPATVKRQEKRAKAIAAANTFEAVARDWLDKTASDRAGSTQGKVATWLEKNVFPAIGRLPISTIKPRDVLEAVRKIEQRGAIDSAHRVKQICGQVFRYAVAAGLCERDITADLRGALATIPKANFAAITEPAQVAVLLRAVRSYNGNAITRAALQLAPLVFVRPGELRHAEWAEIDLKAATWRIAGAKMKMGVDHIVPLSTQAIAVLKALQPLTGAGRYVLPSLRGGDRPMSENTVNAALRGLGYAKDVMTGHGFRAMARTILDEVLGERVDLIEHQLAHMVKDPNGRAYNRTAHLPARQAMMQRWADYLEQLEAGAQVVQLKHRSA
jgi:integrase